MNREEKKKATRERLIASSLDLFIGQGYENTTILQITEHAGVAKGTFFNYFATKEDVLCDMQSFFATEGLGKIMEVPGPLTPKLMALVAGLVNRLKLTRSLARLMFQACLVSANSLDNHVFRVVELNEALSPIFAYGQETGEFSRHQICSHSWRSKPTLAF